MILKVSFKIIINGGPLPVLTKIAAGIAIITVIAASAGLAKAQSPASNDKDSNTNKTSSPATQTELERLRGEVDQLRAELERLKSIVEKGGTPPTTTSQNAVPSPLESKNPPKSGLAAGKGRQEHPAETTLAAPQSTAVSDNPRLA